MSFFVLEMGDAKNDEKAGWRKMECDLRDTFCGCVCWEGKKVERRSIDPDWTD